MNPRRYNKDFIVEMIVQTPLQTAGSRVQNAPPAILPNVTASRRPLSNLSAIDIIVLTADDADRGSF